MLVDEVSPILKLFTVELNHEAEVHKRPSSFALGVARTVVADIVEKLPHAPRSAHR